jgi:hypothetical protein
VASDRSVVLTSSVAPVRPLIERPAEPATVGNSDRRATPPAARTDVRIQIYRPEPGVNIARVVDERTGEVLHQIPPEQVLNVVEDIVRSIRRKEVR